MSRSFRCSWSIITLCGFTSRCMMPWEWQKSRACKARTLPVSRRLQGCPHAGAAAAHAHIEPAPKRARLEQLVDVEADVGVDERGVERLEVGVVDVLEHQAGRLGLRVAHHIQQLDHVGAAVQVLQDLDLPLDLRSRQALPPLGRRTDL